MVWCNLKMLASFFFFLFLWNSLFRQYIAESETFRSEWNRTRLNWQDVQIDGSEHFSFSRYCSTLEFQCVLMWWGAMLLTVPHELHNKLLIYLWKFILRRSWGGQVRIQTYIYVKLRMTPLMSTQAIFPRQQIYNLTKSGKGELWILNVTENVRTCKYCRRYSLGQCKLKLQSANMEVLHASHKLK